MQPPPKFRVLSPELAKARSRTQPQPPSTSPTQAPTRTPTPSKPHASTTSKPTSSFSFSFFPRTRHASSPVSGRQTVRFLPTLGRGTLRVLRILAPLIPIGLFVRDHVLDLRWVRGPSMTPYLNEDYDNMHTNRDYILVNMWPFGGAGFGWPWDRERKKRLERGMIVMFRSPANPDHVAIKRIIGLPGDRITTREPCLKETQIVPFNHVWLEGDAKDPRNTLDSNTYGPVSISLITGRVTAVLWPRFRLLDWSNWEKGVVEGDTERKFGDRYRQEVRDRVVKEAVQLERPTLS